MKARDYLDVNMLKDELGYCGESGEFFWLKRKPGRRLSGKVGFIIKKTGYHSIEVFGKGYLSHRFAWAIHYGEWPKGEIDHINGDKADNKIQNLRCVSRSGNVQNVPKRYGGSSKYKGVSWHKRIKKWQARIRSNNIEKHLGYFDEEEKAYEVYVMYVKKYHGKYGSLTRHGEFA